MDNKTETEIDWISVKAAAVIIQVTTGRVRQLIDAGALSWTRDKNHEWLLMVDREEVVQYSKSPRLQGKPGHKV